ncbi:hybrid sensor histidine kinase/response regulator [Variovorax paradoxus]|uniref:hybrid sensor histidine kinase/response regulator n=1 Tax=Variovorax paradoxus TaxID=34073 RepID=UPI00248072B7|nr:ATP-binding protein [Variovorax paradoxus]WGT64838.1 ATP-binding protein [Variovorax paradoxus]
MSAAPAPVEQRILLRTATSRDALMANAVLARAQIDTHSCANLGDLVRELQQGAGAVMLAEEVLADPAAAALNEVLASQAPWSDVPVLILARQGADSRVIAEAMDKLANVTVIERPMRVASLISTVRTALRARTRQYQLRDLLDGLREADQRKTEFLATLAHELRNPLAPMSTALTLLMRKPHEAAEALRYYELMGRQIEHMVRLVNDLMEVSRITRGKIELRMEAVALESVIKDAIELSRPLLEGAKHELSTELCDEPLVVRGDGVRLTQVFSNLLNNAAKYTAPGGRIRIVLRKESRHAVVEVWDNGTGIAPEMLKSIFEMFVQVSGTSKAAQGGLGIGLTLVKSLVELHGGSVEATSAGLGRGAMFCVRLPLTRIDAGMAKPQARAVAGWPSSLPNTVLIVDDNRDAADALSDLLQSLGASTHVAYSGDAALSAVADGVLPGLAILDIGMPGMDGCELAIKLRANPALKGLILVALTGWGQQGDKDRIAMAGFDHHLLKPLDLAALFSVL